MIIRMEREKSLLLIDKSGNVISNSMPKISCRDGLDVVANNLRLHKAGRRKLFVK